MRAFKVFVFGLLYGWFIKVAFDRIYRENEIEDIRNENASLKEYIRTLESQLQSKPVQALPAKMVPAEPAPVQTEDRKDDFQAIRGIGPVIEKKLNNAGIMTYADLARLSTQELENILGNTRRLVQEAELIKQAKKLVGKK
jgi:large subunit ribosomal protein L21